MRHIPAVIGFFVLGAVLGSLAPLLSKLEANSSLVKLLTESWKHAMLVEGWWPLPIVGGVLMVLIYVGYTRITAVQR